MNGYYKFLNRTKRNEIGLNCIKIFFLSIILYLCWFQKVYYSISAMSLILGCIMIYFTFINIFLKRVSVFKVFTSELTIWSIFIIISLLIGLLIAPNKIYVINLAEVFIQHLILIYSMIYISKRDNNINFLINSYIIFASLCALTTLFNGVNVYSNRISMSMSTNPNSLGIIMVVGIFCILYKLNEFKNINQILEISILFIYFFILILTGSRKALISSGFIFFYWIFFIVPHHSEKSRGLKLIRNLIIYIVSIFCIIILVRWALKVGMLDRLLKGSTTGDKVRIDMMKKGLELFKKNIIFGVGFNNYRVVSGFNSYSHSTYIEVLACTGIIGSILYFIPYYTIFKKLIIKLKSSKTSEIKNIKLMLALFIIFIFLGAGVIHFYEIESAIVFGLIIAFSNLKNR